MSRLWSRSFVFSDQNMEYFDAVDDLLEESYVHTYSTANFTPKGADANVAVFSSGYLIYHRVIRTLPGEA